MLGCAKWNHLPYRENDERRPVQTSQFNSDVVVVETIFLRLTNEERRELEMAVSSVDQQAIEIGQRRQLDRNGIFAGVIRGEAPPVIQRWVDSNETRRESDTLEKANLRADIETNGTRWQCRPGTPKSIAVKPESDDPIVVLHSLPNDDSLSRSSLFTSSEPSRSDLESKPAHGLSTAKIVGDTLTLPELSLQMVATPHGDGSASISMTPEIKHGQSRSEFVGNTSAIRREYRKPSLIFQDLEIRADLSAGHILLVTGTADPRGVGQHFFLSKTIDGQNQPVVMLIRLAKSARDDLFEH
jgi:hypothetical protein